MASASRPNRRFGEEPVRGRRSAPSVDRALPHIVQIRAADIVARIDRDPRLRTRRKPWTRHSAAAARPGSSCPQLDHDRVARVGCRRRDKKPISAHPIAAAIGRPAAEASASAVNHHGTPLSIGTIRVPGPIIGRAASAASASAGALTAMTSTSCSPSCAGSSDARTSETTVASPWVRCSPSRRNAASVSPRASMLTAAPPVHARPPAIQPPIAPAPTTPMRRSVGSLSQIIWTCASVLRVAEQLDRIDPAPLHVRIAGGMRAHSAPECGDLPNVDAAASRLIEALASK